jgi:hypothetical protein
MSGSRIQNEANAGKVMGLDCNALTPTAIWFKMSYKIMKISMEGRGKNGIRFGMQSRDANTPPHEKMMQIC